MRSHSSFKAICTILTVIFPAQAFAAITLDGTMGRSGAITGPNYAITADLGKQFGGNLFHSFSQFDLNRGEVATFSGPASVANIISRVTGGSASSIDGTIRSTIGGANLYLVNPAGIMFGANASVDVSGSFHVSTADYIKLGTDGRFDASNPANSILSVSPPSAFGFVGDSRASITITDGASLETKAYQPISVVAGDIEIDNGSVYSEGGEIRIVAVGQNEQEVGFTGALPEAGGDLTIRNGGFVYSNNKNEADAAPVRISAGNLIVDGNDTNQAYICSDVYGNGGNAADIEIAAMDHIAITNGGYISSFTHSSADAGLITVNASSITLDAQESTNGTGIYNQAIDGNGNGGDVKVSAIGELVVTNGAVIYTRTDTAGSAGSVIIDADNITIDSDAQILSQAAEDIGHAGNVEVTAKRDLSITNGGNISSVSFSDGDAGYVKASATNIYIDGQESENPTGVVSTSYGSGKSGDIEVVAGNTIQLTTGGEISSNSNSEGAGGNIFITAGDIGIDGYASHISSDAKEGTGNAGDLWITATGEIAVTDRGYISSRTFTSGSGGDISIDAGSVTIDGQGIPSGSGIFTTAKPGSTGTAGRIDISAEESITLTNGGAISSDTHSDGNAGDVHISAKNISLDQGGSISSDAYGWTGNAGNLLISATGEIDLLAGGSISTDTYTSGDGGSVTVEAGRIMIDGYDNQSTNDTGIFSRAQVASVGDAGFIYMNVADSISINNGGGISSDTSSAGKAGDIMITAGNIDIAGVLSRISSDARVDSTGNAGSVSLTVPGKIAVTNGGSISSNAFSSGDGGNININSGRVMIDGQDSMYFTGIASVAAMGSTGGAGSINMVVPETITLKNGGKITTHTSSAKDAGYITISTGTLEITGVDGEFNSGHYGSISSDTYAAGKAGFIDISAKDIRIDQGGNISSDSSGTGNAGYIALEATGEIAITNGGFISSDTFSSGNGGYISLKADNIVIDDQGSTNRRSMPTGIFSVAFPDSTGNAGDISLTATKSISILNGGQLNSDSSSSGNAGNIIITAGNVDVDESYISSDTITGTGSAGNIWITATGNVAITNSGQISSSTWSSGDGGYVRIDAGNLIIDGQKDSYSSGIWSAAMEESTGSAGDIILTATRSTSIMNGGKISSESRGSGNAGNIFITSPDYLKLSDSMIATSAANGEGGSIFIDPTLVDLHNSKITTSVAGGSGNGGNIDLTAKQLVVDNSSIIANAEGGNGGNINLNTQALVRSVLGSVISASSKLGISGAISITSPVVDIGAGLADMPDTLIDINALTPKRCASNDNEISSFSVLECSGAISNPDRFITTH